MPERFELRIAYRKLLIGTLLTVIPLSLVGLYVITHSNDSMEKTIGEHFQTMARITSAEVGGYVQERVLSVAMLASEPAVMAAVQNSNQSYAGMSDQAASARIQQIDDSWNTPQAASALNAMLASPASRVLSRAHDLDPRILRITVTDAKGATVAATHKTMDYYQADEDYWKNIHSSGRGATSVTDILYDEATHAHYIGIGLPIVEPETNRFIGTMDALVNVSSLTPIVNRVQLGGSGRTLLVKEDGTIIAGPDATPAMKHKSEAYSALVDSEAGARSRGSGYVTVDLSGPVRTLVAYADAGLKTSYPALGWTVLVTQDTREAFAPIRLVSRMIWLLSMLGLALVTLLTVYFSLHREAPITDIQQPAAEANPATQNR